MKSFAIVFAVSSLAFGYACSSAGVTTHGTATADGGATGDDGGTTGDDGGTTSDASTPPGSFTLKIGPINVAAGGENTQCVTKRLGNPAAIHVGTFHNVLTLSHHMIVYRVNDTTEQTTPVDCKPFTNTLNPAKGSPLMITQKKDEVLTLPDGVAYTLDANQMIRLELHFQNPTNAPVDVQGTATFTPIPDSAFKDEADFLFIGDPDIKLPPSSSKDLGPIFFKLPAAYSTANFFALTGHEHQYGTNVVVSTATSANDPGTPVYNVPGWLWSEPKTEFFNPPFRIAQNGGFKFTCSWHNTSTQTVTFGESVNNEMCFFWAYYYPSFGPNAAKVCAHTDQVPGGADFCCPGSPLCQYIPGQ